jgi:hypothetical protein
VSWPGGELHVPGVNALFVLACGCVIDGCHDCAAGRTWADGGRGFELLCTASMHGHPTDYHGQQQVTDVVMLVAP